LGLPFCSTLSTTPVRLPLAVLSTTRWPAQHLLHLGPTIFVGVLLGALLLLTLGRVDLIENATLIALEPGYGVLACSS